MAEFILMYQGGADMENMTPEEGRAHRENWMAWIKGLGEAVVNPGQPLKGNRVISGSGDRAATQAVRTSGFAIVMAPDLDAAVKIAKTDPFLALGGHIEVAEMVQMGG